MAVPERVLETLRCLECKEPKIEYEDPENRLVCSSCGAEYAVNDSIPQMMANTPEEQNWNDWDEAEVQKTGDTYYRRSIGELPEKEASKSYARLLKRRDLYTPGDTVIDIGCATAHFLPSLRRILDEDILYTGVDVTPQYLKWGGEIFGVDEHCNFVQCDALDFPFQDNSYDIIIVNLFHFFPNAKEALQESMRVARKRVIWRTPIGDVNYMVKIVYEKSYDELGVLTPDREDFVFNNYMLYTKQYIEELVEDIGGEVEFFERDEDFEEFDNTEFEEFENIPATRTVNNMQIMGNLIMDWQYVSIDSSSV